jgi:hypothetical protein
VPPSQNMKQNKRHRYHMTGNITIQETRQYTNRNAKHGNNLILCYFCANLNNHHMKHTRLVARVQFVPDPPVASFANKQGYVLKEAGVWFACFSNNMLLIKKQ